MNTRTLLLLGGWIALAVTVNAQEPESSPMLAGDNVQAVTPEIIKTIQSLVAKQSPPVESTRLWMLRRHSSPGNQPGAEFVSIEVLLGPRVSTARLIRGQYVLCDNSPRPRREYPPPPGGKGWIFVTGNDVNVDGWTYDGPVRQYAFVAPPDQPFTPAGPSSKSFEVSDQATDEDVVALTDIVGRFAPQYQIERLDAHDDVRSVIKHLARISCVSKHVEMIGDSISRPPRLQIFLERNNAQWNITKIEVNSAPSSS